MTTAKFHDEWKRVPIGSVCAGLYDGPHATPKPANDGPVFLGIKNITEDGHLDLSSIRHIAEEDFADWTRRVEPQPGDIVFTYEATLNRYAIIPQGFRGCLGRRLALIRPDTSKADTRFLFHAFFGEDWRRTIAEHVLSGSTVDRIPLTTFPTFEINLPPLPVQRRIAGILSAYDDLIENNNRRIAILEEMAQNLYREWFVHFRFPGHEHVKMVASELGPIPEGWEVKRLAEVCTIVMGQSPKSEFYNDTGEGLPFHQGVSDFGHRFPVDRKFCTAEGRIAEEGDILFSVRAPVGRINVADKRIIIGRGLSAVRSCSRHQVFTFHQLAERFQEEDSIGGGTIFKAVTRSDMEKINFVDAPDSLVDCFQVIAQPVFDEIRNLTCRKRTLQCTRELLLPKLVSGEIEVAE